MQKRHILLLMLFLLLVFNTWVTLNMNVAVISMVRPSSHKMDEESKQLFVANCPNITFFWKEDKSELISRQVVSLEETYDWNDYEKRLVLSAYHWLSWLSIFPGSVLAQKYGSKVTVGYSFCISALMSSLVPFAAIYGTRAIMCIRMLQGVFSFFAMPGAIMTIIGNWSSKHDRGKFTAVFIVGSTLGFGFGGYLFGFIGQYLHWKYIFHLTSLCGAVWTVLWYYLVYDYPTKHPTISIEEINTILNNMVQKATEEKIPTPWKNIVTSIPVYMIFLLNQGLVCQFWILITFAPLYLRDMFGFDSDQVGVITSLPQFICAVILVFFAWFSDYIIKKQWLSVTNSRKLFGCGAGFLASASLMAMAFVKCDVVITIVCLFLATLCRSIGYFGIFPTVVELSPKFCGIIEGFMVTVSEILNFAFVTGISYLINILPTQEYWLVVFLTTGSIGIVTSTLFLLWGSAETQSWNQGSKKVVSLNNG